MIFKIIKHRLVAGYSSEVKHSKIKEASGKDKCRGDPRLGCC